MPFKPQLLVNWKCFGVLNTEHATGRVLVYHTKAILYKASDTLLHIIIVLTSQCTNLCQQLLPYYYKALGHELFDEIH